MRNLIFFFRKQEGKGSTFAKGTFGGDRTAMCLDNPFHHGKSKSGMTGCAPGGVCPVKPFPDVGQIFFGNADAVIFYGAGDKSVLPETGDENVSAFSSIINSIGNQIDKHPDIKGFVCGSIQFRLNLCADCNLFFFSQN